MATSSVKDFEIYMENNMPYLRRIASNVTGYGHAIEPDDLLQDAIYSAFKRLETYRGGPNDFKPWISRIIRNAYIDAYRRATREVCTQPIKEAAEIQCRRLSPFDVFSKEQSGARIIAVIDGLPDNLAEAARLRFIDDRKYIEIAETLKIPEGTVKSRISRARELIRRNLLDSDPNLLNYDF